MALKTGTRIELYGTPAMSVAPEAATIARWTKVSGPRKEGWHIVRFHDGGRLCIHESGFRVTDNRGADHA